MNLTYRLGVFLFIPRSRDIFILKNFIDFADLLQKPSVNSTNHWSRKRLGAALQGSYDLCRMLCVGFTSFPNITLRD